jgi:hypothetical protein
MWINFIFKKAGQSHCTAQLHVKCSNDRL